MNDDGSLKAKLDAIAATRGGQERQASFGNDIGAMDEPLPEETLAAEEAPAEEPSEA